MRPFYNLRIRFAECEITQNEVARRAGMAPSTMTARMTGQQPFDAWQMDAIAQQMQAEGYAVTNIRPAEQLDAQVDLADLWRQTAQAVELARLQKTVAEMQSAQEAARAALAEIAGGKTNE